VRVPELVRSEALADARCDGRPAQDPLARVRWTSGGHASDR
jgi:hypothetical protein